MRVVFIGCVEFSKAMLEVLLAHPQVELAGVVTRSSSVINADHCDLHPLAVSAGCPAFDFTGRSGDDLRYWLRELEPAVVFCLGWSVLLPASVLAIPPLGVVGYHPTPLPRNRGRHPIIWSLALGLENTASTFFLMDERADAGDLLSQIEVPIAADEDASGLYRKLTGVAREQLVSLVNDMACGRFTRVPQNHELANVWRKRSIEDGRIDWRMSARCIHNLVRALARPYPGADCDYRGTQVKVWRVRPMADAPLNIEPGKVLRVAGDRVVIKCGEGAIEIINHEFNPLPVVGGYL